MSNNEYSIEEHALYLSSKSPDILLRMVISEFHKPIKVAEGYCQYLMMVDGVQLPIEKRKRIAENIQNHLNDMQKMLDAIVKAINIQDANKKSNLEG